ncbi:DoxX family protein [Naumannella halotolerans]
MLASYFITNGAKIARDPSSRADDLQIVATKVVPLVKQVAPPTVSGYVPSNARTLARISGIAQIVGGASLATGIGRRVGAGLIAAGVLPQVYGASPLGPKRRTSNGDIDAEAEAERKRDFLLYLSLLGAALLAAFDTQGKPSLGWRADHARQNFVKAADKSLNSNNKKLSKKAGELDKKARKKAAELEKKASKKAAELQKKANKRTKKLQKSGKKVSKNVSGALGQVPELKL